jgi:hypothetical protein
MAQRLVTRLERIKGRLAVIEQHVLTSRKTSCATCADRRFNPPAFDHQAAIASLMLGSRAASLPLPRCPECGREVNSMRVLDNDVWPTTETEEEEQDNGRTTT